MQRRNRRAGAGHQSRRQGTRLPLAFRYVCFLHRRDQRLLEMRCAFFHVQREPLVAGATQERQHEALNERRRDKRVPHHPRDDRRPSVATEQGEHEHRGQHGQQHRRPDPDERLEENALTPLPAQRAECGEQLSVGTHGRLRSEDDTGETGRTRRATARHPRVAMIVSMTSTNTTMINSTRHGF